MPQIHTTVKFERYTEETPENWISEDPAEHDIKRKYKENAPPTSKPFEGFTVWIPNQNNLLKVHLSTGNKFSYTILKGNKYLMLLDGEDVDAYTGMPPPQKI